eukprot:Sro275_g105730.2  (446) ;mRNA; r:41788-43125
MRDSLRFLKSIEIQEKEELVSLLWASIGGSTGFDDDSVLSTALSIASAAAAGSTSGAEDGSGCANNNNKSVFPPAALNKNQDSGTCFHHGLDKDELILMVSTLMKQESFTELLYDKKSAKRRPSTGACSHCTYGSQANKSRASNVMPSLSECSSMPETLSTGNPQTTYTGGSCTAASSLPKDTTPVACINKNQLFAFRKEMQRNCSDRVPQPPSRRRAAESVSFLEEEDEEKDKLRKKLQRACADRVPLRPRRRRASYADCEQDNQSRGTSTAIWINSPSIPRTPRIPEMRSCADSLPHQPPLRATLRCDAEPLHFSKAFTDDEDDVDFPEPVARSKKPKACPVSRFFVRLWKLSKKAVFVVVKPKPQKQSELHSKLQDSVPTIASQTCYDESSSHPLCTSFVRDQQSLRGVIQPQEKKKVGKLVFDDSSTVGGNSCAAGTMVSC